jgi:threonine dehydrogenase-like Zn-dependent dehydrogenase
MIAATFQGIERIAVTGKAEPALIEPTDAVVKVELCGLCGSDLHPYSGREKGLDVGTTMGHEFTGQVIAAGEEVRRFRPGDAVLSPFSTSCGGCAACRRGLSARCARGNLFGWIEGRRGLEGAQAQFVRVPLADSTLLARPPDLSPIEALLLGDVVSTGFYAIDRAGVGPGSRVAVIGLGAVGLSAVLAARERGAALILALDGVPGRLELAGEFGAIPLPVLDPRGKPLSERPIADEVARLTGGEGVEAVVDAAGSAEATRLAMEIIAAGGFLSTVGVHTEPAFAVTPTAAYDKNLTLTIGRCPVRSRLEELCALQREARLPIERLVTHRSPLAEAPEAYRMFAARRPGLIKMVFEP